MSSPSPRPAKAARDACPLCGHATDPAFRPFCSQGCRDRDLLNWLGDAYHVPGPTIDEDDAPARNPGLDNAS